MHLSRRSLLAGAGSLAVSAALRPWLATAAGGQKVLRLQTRQIEVDSKSATRYGVHQASGAFGLTLDEGDELNVRLENGLSVPSGLHWHGLDTPWRQDGVPYISGPPIAPGQSADYKFPAVPPGTRWMHSRFRLQEQDLLAAPLIIRETSAIKSGMQEVVIFLEDFSWTTYRRCLTICASRNPAARTAWRAAWTCPSRTLNDIDYDAYLANERTLADPAVIDVERNADVRLRIINAGASTNFTIDLGPVEGTLVTVDGNPIVPLTARQFPLGVAQRADIVLRMPADGSAVAVLARREGRRLQTGIVLRPPGAAVAKIPSESDAARPVVGLRPGASTPRQPTTAGAAGRPLGPRRSDRHDGGLYLGHAGPRPGRRAGEGRQRRTRRARHAQCHDDGPPDAPARAFVPGDGDRGPASFRGDARYDPGAAEGNGEALSSTPTIRACGRFTATISSTWKPACSRPSSMKASRERSVAVRGRILAILAVSGILAVRRRIVAVLATGDA